jgi:DNA-binding CsgD family transcriptional regulator
MLRSSITLYIDMTADAGRGGGHAQTNICPTTTGSGGRPIRKLARSRHGPAHLILRARIIAASWQGQRTTAIADSLSCHPQTVRKDIKRFNKQGIEGLADRLGAGRRPRLTEEERSKIIALVRTPPPGKLVRSGETLAAQDQEGEVH